MAQSVRHKKTMATLFAVSLSLLLVYLAVGSVAIPLPELVNELLLGRRESGSPANLILWELRLPRAIACAIVGAGLAGVGAACQAMFRNPLAEPYVLGFSSGAAATGTLAIVLGIESGLVRVGLACAGALLALLFVIAISQRRGVMDMQNLLVGGVVTGALLSGLTTLNLWLAGQDSGKILWWLLGSTTPMYWDRVAVLAIVVGLGTVALFTQGRGLNAFAASHFMAERQGVDGRRVRWTVLIACACVTGVVVGTVGIIGFVGLVAPHIARRIAGNDLRLSMPVSMTIGAALLLFADILSQRVKPGTELPLGAVTATLGAPVLLGMMWKRGSGPLF